MAKKSIQVLPNSDKGGWDIRHSDGKKSLKRFETKQEAVDRAREISNNQDITLVIYNKDGTLSK